MFIQALEQYAETRLRDKLTDEFLDERPVPYLLEISDDGTFLGVVQRMQQVTRGKRLFSVAQSLQVPRSPVNRTSGLHPLLAADDIRYVLGPGRWTSNEQRENHLERHAAFVSLIGAAAEATGNPALSACSRFYARPDQVEKARSAMAESKPVNLVALSVGGPLVSMPAVRDYWREWYRNKYKEHVDANGADGECLVCGRVGPIAPTHEKIKGLTALGGQPAGVSLMSFDKKAFRSYGWSKNENSPVGPDHALGYVLALSDLLRPEKNSRRDIAGTGFIFWLKKPASFDPFAILDQPDPAQVGALLDFDADADPDENEFYLAGVSGNGGRLRVRYWVADTLRHVKRNLRDWFAELRVRSAAVSREPIRFWQLRQAIDREGDPPPDRVIALLRRAIEGRAQPLGYRMLGAALQRIRRAEDATPARLGLVRLCINDIARVSRKDESLMQEELDPEQQNPAYLCGRLLAEYEWLQVSAFRANDEPGPNTNITDRYYPLASSYPALAFPKIFELGRAHLRKLRRKRPGAAVAIEQRIQELTRELYSLPQMLSLDQKGRFALGYFHQKAHSIEEARVRRTENQSGNS